jgi:hypothetical protein
MLRIERELLDACERHNLHRGNQEVKISPSWIILWDMKLPNAFERSRMTTVYYWIKNRFDFWLRRLFYICKKIEKNDNPMEIIKLLLNYKVVNKKP